MSHESSVASGISEQAQLVAIREYYSELSAKESDKEICQHHYPEDVPAGVFVDRDRSAWKRKYWAIDHRPAGAEMFKHLKPGDKIVCYNVERFARNVENCVRIIRELHERGISVHFAMERFDFSTAAGKMMIHVLAAVAQYQSDIQSERIREATAIKKLLGKAGNKHRKSTQWLDSELHIPQPAKDNAETFDKFTVHIYNRVSAYDQKISQLGMGVQREGNLRKAQSIANGNPVVTYEDESVSAFSIPFPKRPGASQMLANLRRGDHVVIYRGDRAFRNARQCCEFVEQCIANNITVHITDAGITTTDEFGRLFFKILAMFAEVESEIKSRRKLACNAWCAERGRPIATIPLQYKAKVVNGKKQLVYDKKRLRIMARIWILRKLGLTKEQVGRTLQAYDCMDRKLKPILKTTFTPRYVGTSYERMESILPKLGAEVTSGLVADAVDYLSRPISSTYLVWCKHPLPLQCTWDRLADCGISPTYLSSLPDVPLHHAASQGE